MPSLKEFRDRITSVKSTKKITSAMKMVAASKLRRAQEHAEAAQPYAQAMSSMLSRVAANLVISPSLPRLMVGTGQDQTHLLVVLSSDRGLCGGFNGNLIRYARQQVKALQREGKTVQLFTVGRKARDVLRREFSDLIVESHVDFGKTKISYDEADMVTRSVLKRFEEGAFDTCSLIYNEFRSVLVQKPLTQKLIPFELPVEEEKAEEAHDLVSPYVFEPDEEAILAELLPKNIGVQIYRALLDSAAGEQAARMTAMDSATRNAGEMIKGLSLQYNRARQAYITKELIEIISGAEAL